jgi:hypothetical protein
MSGKLKDAGLMKLFQSAIDPYKYGLVLRETEDGFVSNGHWAIKKALLEPLQYHSYVKDVVSFTVSAELEELFRRNEEEEVERNVAVYEDFCYYAEREEVVGRRKLKFYILDVPVLFRKVMILKTYADFIEEVVSGVQGSEVKRKLYYVEKVKRNGNKEVRPYFVLYKNGDVIAVYIGCICHDT